MHFQVTQRAVDQGGMYENDYVQKYGWVLMKADNEGVARSVHEDFDTEAQARSNIAKAKRSMKAAARCKVKSP